MELYIGPHLNVSIKTSELINETRAEKCKLFANPFVHKLAVNLHKNSFTNNLQKLMQYFRNIFEICGKT